VKTCPRCQGQMTNDNGHNTCKACGLYVSDALYSYLVDLYKENKVDHHEYETNQFCKHCRKMVYVGEGVTYMNEKYCDVECLKASRTYKHASLGEET